MNTLKAYKSPIILISSIVFGSLVGYFMKEDAKIFQSVANLFLNLLFCVVVPLVFVSLVSSIANSKSASIFKKIISTTIVVFLLSGVISAIFGLLVCYFVDFSVNINLSEKLENIKSSADVLSMFSVGDFYELFSRKNLVALIIFALFLGIALLKSKDECSSVIKFFSELNIVITKLVSFIMMFAPIGLACFFAVLFGSLGTDLATDVSKAIVLYFVLTPFYFIFHNSLFAYLSNGLNGIKIFFKNIITSIAVSLGTCSSVAVIASNIQAGRSIKISEGVNSLVIPLAASLHKPGSVFLAIIKIAVVCAIFHIDLFTLENMLKAVIVAILIGSVVGPIPTGGYISEMVIVAAFSLPLEALPILILIGTIADAPATMLNAASDVSAAMLVDKHSNAQENNDDLEVELRR